MFRRIIEFFKKLFLKHIYFVGSVDKLPEPLTREEELKYIMQNDEESKQKLIEHNLRLVVFLAKKYENTGIDLEDLVSIGTIGLIKGVDSFSKSHGTKITTYCAKCIENEILMYFRSNNKLSKNISINESIGYDKEGNEITILDVLKVPSPDFVEEINEKDNVKLLKKYLSVLTPREYDIVVKRYGLNNFNEMTQKEIAKKLKISRSYVSRIEKRALMKVLREFIKNNRT